MIAYSPFSIRLFLGHVLLKNDTSFLGLLGMSGFQIIFNNRVVHNMGTQKTILLKFLPFLVTSFTSGSQRFNKFKYVFQNKRKIYTETPFIMLPFASAKIYRHIRGKPKDFLQTGGIQINIQSG